MPQQTLAILAETFTIHSFAPDTSPDPAIFAEPIYFIGRTADELSVVVPDSLPLDSLDQESDWRCLEVLGPLALSLTGILSGISGVLAAAGVSIFAVSTFETDYILVKSDKLEAAILALQANNYLIIRQ